ncbi:MAG: hypothetical protein OXF23_05330 [Candidatus Dadabacteria bacterium]|nr:hypothetical protein [Candidatus Dadabacteria bacterium]
MKYKNISLNISQNFSRVFVRVIYIYAILIMIAGILALIYWSFIKFGPVSNRQFFAVLCCFSLTVLWTIQILMVHIKLRELRLSDDSKTADFHSKIPFWYTPHRWVFLLVIILLPIGLSVISQIFLRSGEFSFGFISFQFALSVFIIMITLEITTIYNLPDIDKIWRQILTAALVIDLLAFITFLSLRSILNEDNLYGGFMILFFILSGLISLVSSFITLYYTKTYEQHYRGELQEISAMAFIDKIQALKNNTNSK